MGYIKIKEESKRYIETNENEKTATQKPCVTAKSVLKRKLIASQSYLKKQERSQIKSLILHLHKLKMNSKQNPM